MPVFARLAGLGKEDHEKNQRAHINKIVEEAEHEGSRESCVDLITGKRISDNAREPK
jgi:hypothetical protein